MAPFISVIIPNRNGAATLATCLEAVLASAYDRFEVVVVDDCSTDGSADLIQKYPCRLIRLDRHGGAAKARNVGAAHSRGDLLFFTDADCVVEKDTLAAAARAMAGAGHTAIVGGTYTPKPYDPGFFSLFQSVFINYSETKHQADPDYLATHALVMTREGFAAAGGFPENFLPILEDVAFCHALKKRGYKLRLDPAILVRHIFNYSLCRSLANGIRKAKFWTLYSLRHRDLTADSGTASIELKSNVIALFLLLPLLAAARLAAHPWPLLPAALVLGANLFVNRHLLRAFYRTAGPGGMTGLFFYYILVYPFAVAIGAGLGILLFVAHRYR